MGYVAGDKIDESPEWSAVVPEKDIKIPEFGMEPAAEKTAAEIEAERVEAERIAAEGGGKTPEQIETERVEAERIAAEGGGKTADEIAAEKEIADKAAAKEAMRKELLAEMGVASVDEVKKLKTPAVPETPEEKIKRQEREEANFHQYAVQQDKMSLAEISRYKQLSAIPASDLVFADFANEYKETHKDRQENGKADPVTDEEVKEAFETAYQTNSDNASLKKTGERAIAARAREILETSKTKYESAKAEFDGLMDRKAKMPEFKAFIQSSLTAAIPPKYAFTVEGREFSVELDGKDFAEIENKFKDDQIFAKFYNTSDRQGLQTSITEEAQRQIAKKYLEKVAQVANQTGYSAGLKEGKIGARAPFEPDNRQRPSIPPAGKLTEEEKQNIKAGLGQY